MFSIDCVLYRMCSIEWFASGAAIHVHIHTYESARVYMYIHTCIHTHTCIYTHTCESIYIHVYTCINFASGTELVAYFNFSEEISEKLKYVCVCASP